MMRTRISVALAGLFLLAGTSVVAAAAPNTDVTLGEVSTQQIQVVNSDSEQPLPIDNNRILCL